jgi:hypothetical protein
LGARVNGIHEVAGSIPASSTNSSNNLGPRLDERSRRNAPPLDPDAVGLLCQGRRATRPRGEVPPGGRAAGGRG